jgi:hypothetical protein
MTNPYLAAYEAALESLPLKQRHAFQRLMHQHGLQADDPIIVGPVFTHMLLNRTSTVLTRLEAASDSGWVSAGRFILKTFSDVSKKGVTIGVFFAVICVFLLVGTGYTVHQLDVAEEHSRVCVAESLFMNAIERYAVLHGSASLASIFEGRGPAGCGS